MKIYFILFIVSLASLQAQWKPVSIGSGAGLYTVQFFDVTTGFIAGEQGFVSRTTDGGATWKMDLTIMNYYSDLYSATVYGGVKGYIVGRSGVMLKTTDMGLTWTPKFSFATRIGAYYLTDIKFVNDSLGWMTAVTNALFRTKFGDESWTMEYLTKEANGFNYFYTKDCISGYLVGDNGIAHKTNNGGYSSISLSTGVTTKLESVTFVSDSVGFIVGTAGTILKTTNAGKNWAPYQANAQSNFNAVKFVSDSVGWIVGSGGTILKTTDAGASWNSVLSGTTSSLRSVCFNGKELGFIVGDNGTVLKYDPSFILKAETEPNIDAPLTFSLKQNYPNPFNPSTTVSFSIPQAGLVTIKIFDLLGKEISTIAERSFNAGAHTVQFDAKELSTGTYLCRLTSGANTAVRKMILLK